jgi:hypothetical protein
LEGYRIGERKSRKRNDAECSQQALLLPIASKRNRYEMIYVASDEKRYKSSLSLPCRDGSVEDDFTKGHRIVFLL